jgi:hypothetical protein
MVSGLLVDMKIVNPDAGAFTFYGVKGETSTYILGGYENEDNKAMDASGALLITKDIKPGSIEGVFSNNMTSSGSAFEFAQAVQNSLNESTITFSNVNEVVYGGSGTIVGEISLDAYKGTISIKCVSGLGFTKQSLL